MAEVPLFVVDATVAAKWHLKDEEFVEHADLIKQDHLDGKIQLMAPSHIYAEVGSSIRKATLLRRLRFEQALASIQDIPNWGVLLIHELLLPEALALSRRFSLSFHDSLYLALAEDIGCPSSTQTPR